MSGSTANVVKFEAMFEAIEVDPDGKKFDRVSRFSCRSTPYGDSELSVDVNVDAYPMDVGTKFTFVLASTLNADGKPEDATQFEPKCEQTLADEYEYVMHGKCYKKTENVVDQSDGAEKTMCYISFGGLLARVKTDVKTIAEVDVDDRVYCLMRKIA